MLRGRLWLLRHAGRRHLPAASAGRTAAATAKTGHPAHPSGPLLAAIYQPVLATGFARAFLAAAGIAVLNLVIAIAATRSAAPTSPAPSGQPRLCPPSRHNRGDPGKDTCDRRDTNDHQTHHGGRTQSMA